MVSTDKDFLRKTMRNMRKNMSFENVEKMSKQLTNVFLKFLHGKNVQTIMSYQSFENEVDTSFLHQILKKEEKRLLLPRIENRNILAIPILETTAMVKNLFGIWEPLGAPYCGKIDVILVPGLVFDRQGNRIGFGKGYYDQFLKKHPESLKIALVYPFQILDHIPVEPHDESVTVLSIEAELTDFPNVKLK
jgi:5-formyltetrahydrofolate cyclo-ligase